MRTTHRLIAVVFALTGCSDDVATPGGDVDVGDADGSSDVGDTAGDTAGDTDGDTAGDTDGDTDGGRLLSIEDPILTRAPMGGATCEVERAVTQIAGADYQIEALIAAGTAAIVTRAFPTLSIARANLDGTFGDALVLDAREYAASQSRLAYDGSSVAVVWFQQGDSGGGVVRFAKVAAADLTLATQATDIAIGQAEYLTQPVIVARAGGWALLYVEQVAGVAVLRFVTLDVAGAVASAPVTVARGGTENLGFAHSFVVDPAGGYAATWTSGSYAAAEVMFARLDAAGAVVSGPHRISREAGGGYSSGVSNRAADNRLLAHGGKYFAAFTESYDVGSFPDQTTSVIARIAVLDAEGNGELHRLQAPIDDMTTVQPSLHLLGDDVGVLWSYGTVIYICGGCITDYDLHFVLLDPGTMRPVAPEVVAPSDRNGFTNPRGAVVAGKLLTTTALDFHALSYPATGVFACTSE